MRWVGRSAGTVLAISAAVAATAGLGMWLADDEGRRVPRPTEKTVSVGAPAGTVPSVFGHTRQSASEVLRSAGLEVHYEDAVSCDPEGRPVGTDPVTGVRVEPGATVTLLLAYQGATTDCAADLSEPWRFMDFATGRGPAPPFADRVRLFVDHEPATTLPGSRARLGRWGDPSALTELSGAAAQVVRSGDQVRPPSLDVHDGTPLDDFCGVSRPAPLRDREALTLTIALPGGESGCPTRVSLYRTAGEIDAVMTWTARAVVDPSAIGPVPDVVGMTLDKARNRVTAAGFTARVERLETCHPDRGVVEQAPTQGDLEQDLPDDPTWSGPVTLVVEVAHTTRDCAALDTAAATFLRFARGGQPPRWSSDVQQLFGYALRERISAARADDRAAWAFCTHPGSDCRLSPLVVAGAGPVRTGEWNEHLECELVDRGGLPAGLYAEDHIVLFPAEPPECDTAWSVELWVDESGRISAVNLLVADAAVD